MTRDKYWDIVKGIGIICVVLGHSFKNTALIAYVYLFHLPLFFFVSGYLYNEERYGDDLPKLVGQKLVGIMPRFMIYGAIFVLLHNPMISSGAMAGELYNHTQMLWSFLSYGTFTFTDSIAGALWFIPMWLLAVFIFGIIVSVARRHFGSEGVKIGVMTALCIGISIVGVFLMKRDMKITLRLEVACAMVIIILLGYLLRLKAPQFRKYTKWYVGIACGIVLWLIQTNFKVYMDLASNYIEPMWYVITAVLGVGLCLVLAEYIGKIPYLRDLITLLGEKSLDIMALHFAVFKIIDIAYVKIHPEMVQGVGTFPCGFSQQLWWAYLILGLAIPTLIGLFFDKVKKKILTNE